MTNPAAVSRRPAWFAPERILSLLLVFVALAPLAEWLHWGSVPIFVCAGLAIVPLAGIMGESTEKLAERFGAGVGGLLNATFGNAAEMIIALVAMQKGLYDVVKASLTGSIIGNVLLVLGLALFCGGLKRERQKFDRAAAAAGSTMLALAAIALVIPAMFHFVNQGAVREHRLDPIRERAIEGGLSLEIAIVLFVVYVLSLLFSLHTHKHLYAGDAHGGHGQAASAKSEPLWKPLLTLLVATALVAWMSELLVGAVEEASHALGLTPVFVGVIVVAVIGNAAEHSTAVLVAIKNQMDLAMNIAIGSSIQIALFVAPVLVFISYFMPHGPMDLRFSAFEVMAVAVCAGVANLITQDGESNWLEGALLVAVYVVIAIAFFFLP